MAELTIAEAVSEVSSSFETEGAQSARASRDGITMSSVVEMLLKNRAQLNGLLRNETFTAANLFQFCSQWPR